jgi:hypothetical protein
LSLEIQRHTETVGEREWIIDAYPENWAAHTFAGKATWLQRHTSPRCTYAQACQILSAHAAERRRAEAEQHAKAAQELIDKQEAGGVLMSVEEAGRRLVRFGGVHLGHTLAHVAAHDPSYLAWMAGQSWIAGEQREAVLVLCHHHREAIAAARTARRAMR